MDRAELEQAWADLQVALLALLVAERELADKQGVWEAYRRGLAARILLALAALDPAERAELLDQAAPAGEAARVARVQAELALAEQVRVLAEADKVALQATVASP